MYENIKFAEKGQDVTIYPNVILINPENIHLKNRIIISEFAWIHGGLKTMIGNFIHISSYCSIAGGGTCIFEDFVGLSAGVRIISGSEMIKGEGLTNPTIPSEYRAVYRSFVHLEKHTFLATNVVVFPGVTIGEGAVIAANSVVTKDIKPWTINAGSPARVIGQRPSEKIKYLENKIYDDLKIEPFILDDIASLKVSEEFIP